MERTLTQGNAFKNIVLFSIPFLLANLLQTLYGMADLFIVGQFNGAASLSGVSIGSQVMHMLTVMIIGLGMGTTVMIGRAVGLGSLKEQQKVIGNSIVLFVLAGLAATGLLLWQIDSIVAIMLTPVEAIEETRWYLMICFAGLPFIMAYNVISSIFRGLGDSKSPLVFVAVACVLNIMLDFLFIGVFGMRSAGAACGTVLSQACSVLFALIVIGRRKLIHIERKDLFLDRKTIRSIVKIGMPISLQDGLIQISFIIITIIANARGVEIAATVGVVEKVIGFFFLVPSSMLSSISAICAQCVGIGQHRRAFETLKYGCLIGLSFGLFFTILCQFLSGPIVSLFTHDPEVIRFGTQYLRAYVADCVFASISFGFGGYFTAYGYSMISFLHNVVSIVLVRVPGAYFTSKLFPDTLFPMGLTSPLGSLLSATICVSVYFVMRRKGVFGTAENKRSDSFAFEHQ